MKKGDGSTMTAGYSGTPLPRKLGIKSGHSVLVLNGPERIADLIGELPHGVELLQSPPEEPASRSPRNTDVLLLFCDDHSARRGSFSAAHRLLAWDGGLWVCWPKQRSPMAGDLKGDDVRAHGLSSGLVDNKVCAIDQDWSGLRFVHRVEDRPGR